MEDHLFNDLSVQQTYLLHIAEVLPAGDAQGKRALMAIGFLVAGARKCVAKPVV